MVPKVNYSTEKVFFEKFFWNARMVGKQKSSSILISIFYIKNTNEDEVFKV